MDVQVGQQFISGPFRFGDYVWLRITTVIRIEPMSTRFGQPDRIVYAETVSSVSGKVLEKCRAIWLSQLNQGLG